ncbi:MAG: hypothetical protein Q8J74_13355 [Candidatus Didemnitutus sp.]|nr:hypothetical protein [Candidatus Didemnitutus sp.]
MAAAFFINRGPAASHEKVATVVAAPDPVGAKVLAAPAQSATDARPSGNIIIDAKSTAAIKRARQDSNATIALLDSFRVAEKARASFGPVVRGLHLDEKEEALLLSYLIQRSEARVIGKSVADEMGILDDWYPFVEFAVAEVDAEFAGQFSPKAQGAIHVIVNSEDYIRRLHGSIGESMAKVGAPLKDEQYLPLTRILLQGYGQGFNPAMDPVKSGVNAQGLMASDLAVIESSRGILSSLQVEALRDAIVDRNKRLLAVAKSSAGVRH